MRKQLILSLALLFIVMLKPQSACCTITLNVEKNVTMKIGEWITIRATSDKTSSFAWSNSNEDVVNSYGGNDYRNIEAKAEGTATITCYEMPLTLGVKTTCKITVSGYAKGYLFTVNSSEGVPISFSVNDDEKTCSVYSVAQSTSGNVTIPSSANGMKVTGIGKEAFYNCKNITSVVIPEGIVSIGESAFGDCSSLTSISLPSSIRKLGDYSFFNCSALESISGLNSQIEYVGYYALHLTAWYDNLPDGILYIGKVLYRYKGRIPEEAVIDVREGTTMITNNAFLQDNGYGNYSLTIPSSVTYIQCDDGGNVSSGLGSCPKAISVAPENPVYDSRDNSSAIIETATNTLLSASHSTTTIPLSIKVIWDNAFTGYSGASITIPNNVNRIGNYAFESCI